MWYGSLAGSEIKFLEIRQGVLMSFYGAGECPTSKNPTFFYPDMRLKMAEFLDFFIYSTALDYLQGR